MSLANNRGEPAIELENQSYPANVNPKLIRDGELAHSELRDDDDLL